MLPTEYYRISWVRCTALLRHVADRLGLSCRYLGPILQLLNSFSNYLDMASLPSAFADSRLSFSYQDGAVRASILLTNALLKKTLKSILEGQVKVKVSTVGFSQAA